MISVITPANSGTSRTRLASRLLAGTALMLLLSAGHALANGGRGGDRSSAQPGSGGPGGIDNPTGAGGAGVRGQTTPGGNAGGGGGGAGAVSGGAGGLPGTGITGEGQGGDGGVHGSVGAALPVGAKTGSNGGDGNSGYNYSGGGGGAGGYGAVVTGTGATGAIAGTLTGGNGGHGGGSFYGFGGGGGSGGIGLLFTDGSATQTLTIDGTIQGGKGGNGGSYVSDGTGAAGAAGVGGAGLVFTNGGATTTLTVNGTIRGGDGGRGGSNLPTSFGRTPNPGEEANGVGAAGGAAIIGAGLSITNNGTIVGGLSGDGSERAAAIHFTGGSNRLTMGNAIATIIGGIVIDTGTLTFDQTTNITISNVISGGGGVGKDGAGTVVLSGANTYTGGTTLIQGKLSVSQDANLGASSGGLTFSGASTLLVTASFTTARAVVLNANGTVEVAAGQGLTMDGAIAGTGGLFKTGSGTLILTGTNTYTGGTTVTGGGLSISSEANLGNVSAGLTLDGGTLIVTADIVSGRAVTLGAGDGTIETTTGNLTVNAIVGGSGGLTKSGTGTLTLSGVNTYAGGTTISGGKLSISSDANLGNVSGGLTLAGGTLQVTNNVTLARAVTLSGTGGGIEIDAGRAVLLTGAITGTGGLTKTGGGTLALQNNSSYSGATLVQAGTLVGSSSTAFSANSNFTVSAGATLEVSDVPGLVATVGSLAGAGAVQLGSGSTLKAGSSNASTTFSGMISGNGALDKTGTGTLTLTGANTYGGGTTVSGGKLVVNGSIKGAVTLSGGALGGSGTIGALAVASGGTVAPGNSIGTLTINGNVAFASGSTYQVEINAAGQSDRIAATGSATITGGTVQVLAEAGNYAASTTYTILTATGGVTGRFSTVTSNLAFLTPSLSYGAQNVTLTMTRNATGFGPGAGTTFVASTRNQGFIANAAEALGAGNAVYDALLSGTAAEARAGFDMLSGEAHAQGVSVLIDESRLVRDTILSHLRGPLLTQAPGQVAASFSADLPGRKGAVLMAAPLPQPRYSFWGEAFGGTGNSDADGNAASQSRRTGGALLGADLMLYDAPGSSLKLGVAGGYSQSRFDLDARRSSGKLESGHAALYAGARFGNLRFDAGAAYSWSESDIRRQVQVRGFGDSLRLQRPGSVAQGFAELGYAFAFTGFALEPFAQLALIRVSTEAGTERGGIAALRVLSSEQTLGFTTLGLRAEAQIGAMPLFARGLIGWRHGFGELTPVAKTAFVAGITPSRVFAAPIDREALVAEAGLDWRISSSTALGLTYSAAIGERSRDHALKGRVEMRF